jgi:hypothetical protein
MSYRKLKLALRKKNISDAAWELLLLQVEALEKGDERNLLLSKTAVGELLRILVTQVVKEPTPQTDAEAENNVVELKQWLKEY